LTGIDWVIVGAVVLLALFGWAQGFISGVLALVGFVVGAWLGTRLAPLVLSDGRESTWAPAFALVGAIMAGGILAAGFEGVGARLRARLQSPAFAAVDGALGAALTACVGLLIAWVLGAVALRADPDIRRDVQRSLILQQLNAILPPTGPLLNTLRGLDPFPQIDGPSANVPAPQAAIARDPEVATAARSVVKVLGTACGVGVEGSGWVAGDGIVVTNAHVVAGQDDTRVLLQGREPGADAQAIAFDSDNDLAVFPLNGPYDVRPGRLGQIREVLTQDAYGRGPVRRRIASLRGVVRSGNSGGPMVDGDGRVVGTIFAATTQGPRGGYAVPNELVRSTLEGAGGPVDTGPCGG
jgi:S1-C subfamily serine protease